LLTSPFVGRESNSRAGFTDLDHLVAAAEWLERAQDAGGAGGVVGRYRLGTGWTSSYPETTGYIVPTFLRLADTLGQPRFRERARRCIEFLLSVQLESGAFPRLEIAHNRTEPSVFNTAQIICGLRAWYAESNDGRALGAAQRACDWLVAQQGPDGVWRSFLYGNILYTYMAHASCWIAELGASLDHQGYLDAARRHLEWTLSQQDPATGWFDLCGFTVEEHRSRTAPLHTIAYTIWGVLMTSRILEHEAGMRAARKAALALARRLELSRWLPGVLDHSWRGRAAHACLTGNAQAAMIWLELHRLESDPTLLSAACKAIDLVKRAQPMASRDPGIRGGIPGSDPVWGDYIYMAIPNWAAKFFVDALIEKQAALARLAVPPNAVSQVPDGLPSRLPDRSASAPHGSRPRIVLYASPTTHKVRSMVTTWSHWGFRPTAVIVERDPEPGVARRVLDKVRDEGFGALARRLLRPVGRATLGAPAAMTATAASRESTVDYCRSAGIPVVEVGSLDSDQAIRAVRALAPDLGIHAGAGILRKAILEVPRLGTLNAHMGILPRYRGMNVAEWSRLNGDSVGCTVHLIDEGIDTGDIICCRAVSLTGVGSVAQLRAAVDRAQVELLGEVVHYVVTANSLPPRRPQSAGEGRQYFSMHRNLLELLEKELRSGR
jgi:folate-dependent phosphoribosylglycinamide formyltransferase PurN